MGTLKSLLRRHSGRCAMVAAVGIALGAALAGGASGALKTPVPIAPASGTAVGAMPAFAWAPVAGASEYEVQVAADSGFNSPVLGAGKDDFRTKNTRATLIQTAPNGTYWWRVRAISKTGSASPWSQGRSFGKSWASGTTLLSPVGGAAIVYPSTPLKLSWSPVSGARKYLVSIATDPSLGSLLTIAGSNRPIETAATTLTPPVTLAPGTYYWGVTALDAEGNRGVPSTVASFNWAWPSATTPQVTDLSPAPEVYDPRFSWDAVPGAARYEVEINSSVDFAPGSKICCTGTTLATSLSPTRVFHDNKYYWRVRAIDLSGNAGVWNNGPSFTKIFDNVPPMVDPAIKNLHLRDNVNDPGADVDSSTAGRQTEVPIVSWDPVPGAASYQVDVAPYETGTCNWSAPASDHHWRVMTAVSAWTPLGSGWNGVKPYADDLPVANDGVIGLAVGSYCVRVRARTDRDIGNQDVYGDYTYLDDGTGRGTAFDWTGYPAGVSAGCNTGNLCADDYGAPIRGSVMRLTPYFTWKPVLGAQSYFVLVSKDANFTTIVDYGFTQVPAYAPRTNLGARTYSDETTSYYWAVLPAQNFNGNLAKGDPLLASVADFQKQSLPPSRSSPADGQVFFDQPTFRWDAVLGARSYELQVSQDPSFGSPIDDVTTDSTAYSTNTTYPADTTLYWRVRANDENGIGLTWSNAVYGAWTFQKRLATAIGSIANPTIGDEIPNWTWNVVPGAVSYDFSIDQPDGTHKDFSGFPAPSVTPVLFYGTGIFHWRVRAEFPKTSFGLTPGPYSATYAFTRTIREPSGAHADFDRNHVLLSWDPKHGARRYRVQLSGTPEFSQLVENVVTDNTSYAPLLEYRGFRTVNTGRLYWRVAAQDEGDNVGDFTQPQLITRVRRMDIAVQGSVKRGKRSMLSVSLADFETAGPVGGAKLRGLGAGLRLRRWRTNAFGSASLVLKPRRKGYFVITASKSGYLPVSIRLRVR
jgi:hypothetical protein